RRGRYEAVSRWFHILIRWLRGSRSRKSGLMTRITAALLPQLVTNLRRFLVVLRSNGLVQLLLQGGADVMAATQLLLHIAQMLHHLIFIDLLLIPLSDKEAL